MDSNRSPTIAAVIAAAGIVDAPASPNALNDVLLVLRAAISYLIGHLGGSDDAAGLREAEQYALAPTDFTANAEYATFTAAFQTALVSAKFHHTVEVVAMTAAARTAPPPKRLPVLAEAALLLLQQVLLAPLSVSAAANIMSAADALVTAVDSCSLVVDGPRVLRARLDAARALSAHVAASVSPELRDTEKACLLLTDCIMSINTASGRLSADAVCRKPVHSVLGFETVWDAAIHCDVGSTRMQSLLVQLCDMADKPSRRDEGSLFLVDRVLEELQIALSNPCFAAPEQWWTIQATPLLSIVNGVQLLRLLVSHGPPAVVKAIQEGEELFNTLTAVARIPVTASTVFRLAGDIPRLAKIFEVMVLLPVAPARQLITEWSTLPYHEQNMWGAVTLDTGFLPVGTTIQAFPLSHSVWDEVARLVPQAWASGKLADLVAGMPVLDASSTALPEQYLTRAATFLGQLANGHHYYAAADGVPGGVPMPDCISVPWAHVNQRLQRPAPTLHLVDLVLNNWCLTSRAASQTPCYKWLLPDLRILVPFFGNREESVFSLAIVLMHAVTAPLVPQIIRAQEAAVSKNWPGVLQELQAMTDTVAAARAAFAMVDANPRSSSFCDPVIWAKTMGVLPVPIKFAEGVRGASGIEAPMFHLLDVFLERDKYDSNYGKDALIERMSWIPKHHREFLIAVRQISVRSILHQFQDSRLLNAWNTLVDVYSGDKSLLADHAVKAQAYLTCAMQVGRMDMNGTQAASKDWLDSPWRPVIDHLHEARMERLGGKVGGCPFMRLKQMVMPPATVAPTGSTPSMPVSAKPSPVVNKEDESAPSSTILSLDCSEAAARWHAGDYVKLWPRTPRTDVLEILQALRSDGSQPVQLTERWVQFLRQHAVPLWTDGTVGFKQLLSWAAVGWVEMGTLVLQVPEASSCVTLRTRTHVALIEAITALELPADRWLSGVTLATVLRPLDPRCFSICSSDAPASHEHTVLNSGTCMQLMIGGSDGSADAFKAADGVTAPPKQCPATGAVTSRWIHDAEPADLQNVHVEIVPAMHFAMPTQASTPVVMIAAGTGIAPFRAFIQQRQRLRHAGPMFLYHGIRSRSDFELRSEMESAVHDPSIRLQLRVGMSRQQSALGWSALKAYRGAEGVSAFYHRGRVTDRLTADASSHALWSVLSQRQLPASDWVETGAPELPPPKAMGSLAELDSYMHGVEARSRHVVVHTPGLKYELRESVEELNASQSSAGFSGHVSESSISQPTGAEEYTTELTAAFGSGSMLPTGGLSGSASQVFICGSPGFVRSAQGALVTVIGTHAKCNEEEAREHLYALAARRQYHIHAFAGDAGDKVPPIRWSQLILKCGSDGSPSRWLVYRGLVADMSEYQHLHPGGAQILTVLCGMDATDEIAAAHATHLQEIEGILLMYVVGQIQQLPSTSPDVLLQGYHTWSKWAQTLVFFRNALVLEWNKDRPDADSRRHEWVLLHQKFVATYLPRILRCFADLAAMMAALRSGSDPNWSQLQTSAGALQTGAIMLQILGAECMPPAAARRCLGEAGFVLIQRDVALVDALLGPTARAMSLLETSSTDVGLRWIVALQPIYQEAMEGLATSLEAIDNFQQTIVVLAQSLPPTVPTPAQGNRRLHCGCTML